MVLLKEGLAADWLHHLNDCGWLLKGVRLVTIEVTKSRSCLCFMFSWSSCSERKSALKFCLLSVTMKETV